MSFKPDGRADPAARGTAEAGSGSPLSKMRTATAPPGRQLPTSPFLKPGTSLGHFEIIERLGSGGFGDVYRARDTRLGRIVAIKALPEGFAQDAARRERFRLEAKAASALNHPHICTIHDLIEFDGRNFIVMELVEGRTLQDLVSDGPLPASRAIELAMQIASGLAEAHAAGILHRDIKTSNIVVTAKGQAKILDFGIAKRLMREGEAGEDADALTRTGTTPGTLRYMSPEQLLGKPIDARSDLFSLGVVLYEMVTGQLPFGGSTPIAVADALLHNPPREFGDCPVPERLKAVILKLLEKDRDDRFGSAEGLRAELASMAESLGFRVPRRRPWMAAAGVAALAACLFAGWLWHRSSRARWALAEAIPEIEQLVASEDFPKAASVLREARAVLPKDSTLEKLWRQATFEVSVKTEPPGADVMYRPYRGESRTWTALGRTPVTDVRIPRDFYLWRVEKAGFAPAFEIQPSGILFLTQAVGIFFRLETADRVPTGLVEIPGGPFRPTIRDLDHLPEVALDDFLIDRHEVTNEDFKKFVNAGGYQTREFWKEQFTRDGKTIPFEEAIAAFRDTTGRPGPSTWELGSFPKGLEKHPVAGVSWYESAAYAAFAGKSLPTIYHWNKAAQIEASTVISPASNFQGPGTLPVGDGRISGFGTTDMAGNVKEWCLNEDRTGNRFILGGGFGEPTYLFSGEDAQSPWDRHANYGFRCVKVASPVPRQAVAPVEAVFRDFSKEKPVSDEIFSAYKSLYRYDKGELNARVEETVAIQHSRREKVSFNAAYAGERMIAYLFLPEDATSPYQTVVYFPDTNALAMDRFVLPSYVDFIIRSGRALMAPVFKGTFERRDGILKNGKPVETAAYRDHMIAWEKDLSRSLDYLETRPDIRRDALAYFGVSWGSNVAPVMLAVENRFKVAILVSGGLHGKSLPEADSINFASHVRIPILLLNGRYDNGYPVETSQRPLVQLLGTPEEDKRWVVYETGHAPPLKETYRETLDWLDKYLGQPKR